MAWLYESAGGVLTLAVIGDQVGEELRLSKLYQLREQQGLHCSGSVQGVLLKDQNVQLSKKREQIGVLCDELGLDEKEFWLLSHP